MNDLEQIEREAKELKKDWGGRDPKEIVEWYEAAVDELIAMVKLEAEENSALTGECNELRQQRDAARVLADQLAHCWVAIQSGEAFFKSYTEQRAKALDAYKKRSWK